MRTFPIIPVWLMVIICLTLLFFILIPKHKKFQFSFSMLTEVAIVILLFLINLRIMIPSDKALVATNNLDILFVIDNSISMVANDYQDSTRLEGLKEVCNYIIENLNGARFSVITFDNTSKLIIPFTKDTSMARESISVIQYKAEYIAAGSSLNAPKENLLSTLKNSQEKENRKRIVFFISDGEITREEETLESYSEFKEYIDDGAVLGFGSEAGGTMYVGEKGLRGEYIMETYGENKGVSKIDEKNLKQLASDMNIDYIHIEKKKDIDEKIKDLKKITNSSFESSDKSSYEDTYFFFLIPLLLLLLIHFRNYKGVYK